MYYRKLLPREAMPMMPNGRVKWPPPKCRYCRADYAKDTLYLRCNVMYPEEIVCAKCKEAFEKFGEGVGKITWDTKAHERGRGVSSKRATPRPDKKSSPV